MSDDFFGNEGTVKNDMKRYGIGDGTKGTLTKIQGVYEETLVTEIDGKDRMLHQIKTSEPIDGKERCLVWGNADIDQVLPTLTPGTKFRATFVGKEDIGKGRTLKRILVEFPANAKRRPNPFKAKSSETTF